MANNHNNNRDFHGPVGSRAVLAQEFLDKRRAAATPPPIKKKKEEGQHLKKGR